MINGVILGIIIQLHKAAKRHPRSFSRAVKAAGLSCKVSFLS